MDLSARAAHDTAQYITYLEKSADPDGEKEIQLVFYGVVARIMAATYHGEMEVWLYDEELPDFVADALFSWGYEVERVSSGSMGEHELPFCEFATVIRWEAVE